MRKIILIFAVAVATFFTSCNSKKEDPQEVLLNALNEYSKSNRIKDSIYSLAADITEKSGKYCVVPRKKEPCIPCIGQGSPCGDRSQQVVQQPVQEAVPANPNVYNYNYNYITKKEIVVRRTVNKTQTRRKSPCVPCSTAPAPAPAPDSVPVTTVIPKTTPTVNTICIDGEKYVISADQNIPQQAYSNYRMVNGVIYQKVSSLK